MCLQNSHQVLCLAVEHTTINFSLVQRVERELDFASSKRQCHVVKTTHLHNVLILNTSPKSNILHTFFAKKMVEMTVIHCKQQKSTYLMRKTLV